jgi:hypothetical protein
MPQYSPPALVAGAPNEQKPFVIPQYPTPVITDFERALSSPVDLGLAVTRMWQNLAVWLNNTRTYYTTLLFDNISMASARAEDLSKLPALAQAALRKPKRLLVNIGANNGCWSLAFEAKDVEDTTDKVPATVEFTQKFPEHMKEVAACLAALPKGPNGVQHIYVNNLPHLSVLANLMPLDRNTLGKLRGCDKN